MNLLLLINGNKENILKSNVLRLDEFEVVKIDEKDISKPRFIINLINSKKYEAVFFGTIENELQRFQIFIKIWILFSKVKKGGIIDELGHQNIYNIKKLLFMEFPLLFIETISSIFIVIYFYLKLPILKWRLKKS
jgi:hypothetical protein